MYNSYKPANLAIAIEQANEASAQAAKWTANAMCFEDCDELRIHAQMVAASFHESYVDRMWWVDHYTARANEPILNAMFADAELISRDAVLYVAEQRQLAAAVHVDDAMFFLGMNMPTMAMLHQDKARMMYRQARRILVGAEHDIDPATCIN